MFSNWTITKKGLILIVVPVIFLLGFCLFLSNSLSDSEHQIRDLRRAKEVLLELNRFETEVARSVLIITNPQHQDAAEMLPEIKKLKLLFAAGQSWNSIDDLDPELKEVVEDSMSMRKSMLKFLDKLEAIVNDPTISIHRRPKLLSTRALAGTILSSHDLAQRVVQLESRVKSKEPEEIAIIRASTLLSVVSGVVFGVLLTLALAAMFTKDILKRLRIISEKAHLVSAGRSLPPPQMGRDEIAQLDRVVHETNAILAETRRKEVAILDNAADVICSLDERFKFAGMSATVDKIWKCSQDELLGSPLISILAKQTQASSITALEEIAGGTHEGEFENIVRLGDGTFKNFSWSVRWSPKEKSYFCVAHDITERRAVEKMKQHFLSIVSHDLRAPITATGLSISLLMSGKRGQLSDDVLKILGRTESSISRLTELVNELLELDKLEAGKLTLEKTTVSAFEVLTAAKENLEAMATSAHVKISGPKADAAVFGDEGRLIQAVTNLLSNAIKFSPRDGIVELGIVNHDGTIEIRITDQGPGIAREDAALIFDKFRQSHTAKQTSVKSTGLGLAIVKAIIEAHGGLVGVDSEVGHGSTFWIRLPEDLEDNAP